jgi:hypothetical protein
MIHRRRDSSQKKIGAVPTTPTHGPPLVDAEPHSERGRGEQRSSDEPHRRNEKRNESRPVHQVASNAALKAGIRPGPSRKVHQGRRPRPRLPGTPHLLRPRSAAMSRRHDAHDADDDDSSFEHASGNKAQCEALVLPLDH